MRVGIVTVSGVHKTKPCGILHVSGVVGGLGTTVSMDKETARDSASTCSTVLTDTGSTDCLS